MDKIIMLTRANISKSKSQAVSLLIFVLIAVMFLNIGLVIYINFGKFFDKRAEELHAPHVITLQSSDITTDEQITWLEEYPNISEIERQSIVLAQGEHYMNGSKNNGYFIFMGANNSQKMNPLTLIGESLPLQDNKIYIPYLMKVAGGHDLGDSYIIYLNGIEFRFTIAGFTEEIPFGSLMYNIFRFYISDDMYNELRQEYPDMNGYLTSVRMENYVTGMQLQLDYDKKFFFIRETLGTSSGFIETSSYDYFKYSRTFISTIMSFLMVAFALILLVVFLIVIRFRVTNGIEEGMANIGVLKAVGYKSSQIIASLMLQFGSIVMIGGILGVLLSQHILPFVSYLLERQSAMVWNPEFDGILSSLALCFMLFSVLLIVFMSVKCINRLHPLIALRGGIETHSFRKNSIPLDTSHGRLSFLLALKQLLQNKKQGIMIIFIIAILSFASVSGLSIYKNVGVDSDKFISLLVGELSDLAFVLADSDKTESVLQRISERKEVRKAIIYQQASVFIEDEINAGAIVVKDFSQLEGNMLYQGRYPKYSNEVAIGGAFSKVIGKKIGNYITIGQGKSQKEFIITGIVQTAYSSGKTVLLTCDGMLNVKSDFIPNMVYVYLNEGTDVKTFIESVLDTEGEIFTLTVEATESVNAQFASYGTTFAVLAVGILIITVMIVILTLYIVIKAMIIRRKREIGIQKALGYTTWQIMNQIALNMTPIVLIGVVLGGIGGYFGFNPLFSVLTHSMGIIKADLPSPVDWTILTCISLTVLAYLVSMLISWRIRKISAYSLISE